MNSRKTIRPVRNTLRVKKNVMRGRGVVVLDRLHAKEAIYEDENHRKFQNAETAGGSLVIAKTNRIGGTKPSRKARSQDADLYNRSSTIRPSGAVLRDNHSAKASISGQGLPNNIKIPLSLQKKKENRNNIKLVL
jgi:hypothetical protein